MLVTQSAKTLNIFPAKGGVSPYFSAQMIVHGRRMDYKKH
jgi:hypothetical protein